MGRLSGLYNKVQFVNLLKGALGINGESCEDLVTMLGDLGMNKKEIAYVLCKLIMCYVLCVHTTYILYILI